MREAIDHLPSAVILTLQLTLPFLVWVLLRSVVGTAVRATSIAKRMDAAGIKRPTRRAIWGSISALIVAAYWDDVWAALGHDIPDESWPGQALRAAKILALTSLVVALWDTGADRLEAVLEHSERRTVRVVMEFTQRLGRFLLWGLGLLTVAYVLGYNVQGLIAGLGVGGVALALAAKDSVENLFGALTIVLDRPFDIGDWVKIGDVDGTVETISLRSTRIRTFEDSVVTMPNSTFIKANVENLGIRRERRVRVVVPFRDTDPAKLRKFAEGLRAKLGEHEEIDIEKVRVALQAIGVDGSGVLVQCYLNVPGIAREDELRQEILLEILEAAEQCDLQVLVR